MRLVASASPQPLCARAVRSRYCGTTRGVRPIYERHAPELAQRFILREADEVPGFVEEMEASGAFRVRTERQFTWDRPYSADAIVGLLRTYSDHRRLPRRTRTALLNAIHRFVVADLDGAFLDGYVTTLCVGELRRGKKGSDARH